MPSLIWLRTQEELQQTQGMAGVPSLEPGEMALHAPDVHGVLLQGEERVARCSLWWSSVPAYPDQRLGLIGHYAVRGVDSGRPLLAEACDLLAAQGCTLAVGPMDGTPWRRYRLITERGTEPPFFLEPDNPDDAPFPFQELGFAPLAEYVSALNTDLCRQEPRVRRTESRLREQGIRIRTLDPSDLERELRRVYILATLSFRNSYLASPITEEEFLAQYRRLVPYVQPELTLLAEQEDHLVGFLFALPDWLQAQRGEPVDTVILKTIAVLPGRAYAGLGNVLAEHCHRIAHERGFTCAIHALMPEHGHSRNISNRYAHTIRRYTLFARTLPR